MFIFWFRYRVIYNILFIFKHIRTYKCDHYNFPQNGYDVIRKGLRLRKHFGAFAFSVQQHLTIRGITVTASNMWLWRLVHHTQESLVKGAVHLAFRTGDSFPEKCFVSICMWSGEKHPSGMLYIEVKQEKVSMFSPKGEPESFSRRTCSAWTLDDRVQTPSSSKRKTCRFIKLHFLYYFWAPCNHTVASVRKTND